MSGSIGANRIPRAAVESTLKAYIEKVLNKFPGFKTAKISGSYNTTVKPDHGDLDLIIHIEGDEKDKKKLKQNFASFISSLPDDITIPFTSGRHIGKKAAGTGDIVIVQFPIEGYPDLTVQIDNMIVASEEESDYRKGFLDLPAEKQGLLVGLAKAILLEENPEEIFKRLGITNIPKLEKNQELEFNLSSKGLTLRLVTLTDDFKEVGRNDIWTSFNWNDVLKLFQNYKLDGDWQDLLKDIKSKIKNPRSMNRIKGVFRSLVVINAGEAGTPKGDNKQMALNTVAALEEKYGSFAVRLIKPILEAEAGQQSIAVFPGAFKPPHASHLKAIQVIAPKVDKVYVYVSKQPRVKEGQIPINADQAMAIWDLYKQKGLIPDNVEIKLASNATPVLDAYQEIEAHPENKYLAVFGKDEEDRWKSIEKNREKYGHVTPFNIGNLKGLSASDLRTALKNKDVQAIQTFLPKGVTAKEYIQALIGQKKLQEIVTDTEVICDNCGWSWSIEDGGDDLYICHKCNHDNNPKNNQNKTWDLKEGIVSLSKHMIDNGLNIKPLPKVKFISNDEENASNMLGKTAYYNPAEKSITLFTLNRHPKDILRSFSHEMIHHFQNLENRLNNIQTTNTNEDGDLPELEKEAYEKGNIMLRNWEDSIKNV